MQNRRYGKSGARRSAYFTGAEGRAKSVVEQENIAQRRELMKTQQGKPQRFFLMPGKSTEIVILDSEPSFFGWEHNLKGPTGKFTIYTGCVNEYDNCPVCESTGKPPTWMMYFSILDLTRFKNRNDEQVEFSRKLLAVKPGKHPKFNRLFDTHKNMRGLILNMSRDGEKDHAIGNDIEFVERMDEQDLKTYVREWKDKEGKKHTENCFEVYDYFELFPEPTVESLRLMVGGRPSPGSRESDNQAIHGRRVVKEETADDWEDPEKDNKPWDESEAEQAKEEPVDTTMRRRTRTAEPAAEVVEESKPEPTTRRRAVDDTTKETTRPLRRAAR